MTCRVKLKALLPTGGKIQKKRLKKNTLYQEKGCSQPETTSARQG
jgi:hypothetical protein